MCSGDSYRALSRTRDNTDGQSVYTSAHAHTLGLEVHGLDKSDILRDFTNKINAFACFVRRYIDGLLCGELRSRSESIDWWLNMRSFIIIRQDAKEKLNAADVFIHEMNRNS